MPHQAKQRPWLQQIDHRLPELYLLLTLPIATLLCFLTAPFFTPDEQHHAAHAIALAHGIWLAHPGPAGEAGAEIDANALRVMDAFDTIRMAWEPLSPDFLNRRYGALTPQQQQQSSGIHWARHTAFATFPNTAVYPPTLYLPAIAAWRIAESTDLTILQGLHLARLLSALTAVALGWLALHLCRIPRWHLLAFLLLPSVVFLNASCSQDSILLSLAALIAATLTRPLVARRNLTHPELVLLALMLANTATARPPYLILSLLLFLPAANMSRPAGRNLLAPSAAFLLVIAIAASWRRLVRPLGLDPSDLADPTRQIAFLTSHPLLAARALLHGTLAAALDLVHRGLYIIGWNDLLPPPALTILLALSLAIILILAPAQPILHTRAARILLALSIAAPLLGISLAEYIIWTPTGAPTVYGIQPRYWLPILPTASLFLPTLHSSPLARGAAVRLLPMRPNLLLVAVTVLAASTLTLPFFAANAFYRQNLTTILRLNLP